MKIHKKKTKPNYGYCNICGQKGKLTVDHVPPKGSIILRSVELKNFAQRLSEVAKFPVNYIYTNKELENRLSRKSISQNGLKFRTICANCNNHLLGLRYDPEVKRVSHKVTSIIRARLIYGLTIPNKIIVPVKTHLLMRGIIGHLLAAIDPIDPTKPLPMLNVGFYKDLKNYFLDESLPLPQNAKIYVWPYPCRDQVIIKGLGLLTKTGGVFGDLLKFFPIAYFVTNTEFEGFELPIPHIVGHSCNDIDCTIEIQLDLGKTPPINWPETPSSEHTTIMLLDASTVAKPKSDIESP